MRKTAITLAVTLLLGAIAIGGSVVEQLAADNPSQFTRLSDNRVARLVNSDQVEVVTTVIQTAAKADLLKQKRSLVTQRDSATASIAEIDQVLALFAEYVAPVVPEPNEPNDV